MQLQGGDSEEFHQLSEAYSVLADAAASKVSGVGAGNKTIMVSPGRWDELTAELLASRMMILFDGTGECRKFLQGSGATLQAIMHPAIPLKQRATSIHLQLVDAITTGKPFVFDLSATRQQDIAVAGLLGRLRVYLDQIRLQVLAYLRTGDPTTTGMKALLPPSAVTQNAAVSAVMAKKPVRPRPPSVGADNPFTCFALEYRPSLTHRPNGTARCSAEIDALVRAGWESLANSPEVLKQYEDKAEVYRQAQAKDMHEYHGAISKWEADAKAIGPAVKLPGPLVSKAFLKENFKPWLMAPDGLFTALITGSLWINEGYKPLLTAAGRSARCPTNGKSTTCFLLLCDPGLKLPFEITLSMPSTTLAS